MFKKTLKSSLTLLLVLSLLIPFASCAGKTSSTTTAKAAEKTEAPKTEETPATENTPTTDAPETANRDIKSNVPDDLKFGTEDDPTVITFAYVEGRNGTYTERSIKLEDSESDGDDVDAEIYKRNQKIEGQLGIEIVPILVADDINKLSGAVDTSLAAGEPDYDIIAGYQYFDIALATKGYILNLNELENNYIDINNPYWATDYINGITYKDYLFWVTGDLSLRYIGGMYGTIINERIYKNTCLSTYGDIYEIARNGNWTLDTMMNMCELAFIDQGTTVDAIDEEDQIGFVIEMQDPCDGIAFGCNIEFSAIGEDGKLAVTFADNPRTVTLANKLFSLYKSKYTYIPESNDSVTTMTLFAAGNVFCTVNKIYQAEVYLRQMEDNYYILPCPKLDNDQTEYATGIHDGCTIYGITYCSENPEAASAVLELMACESYKTVMPAYYDNALKYKYTRDPEAAEMIDLIRKGCHVDFVAAWSNSISGIVQTYRNATGLDKIASTLRKSKGSYNTNLTKLLDKLDDAAKMN